MTERTPADFDPTRDGAHPTRMYPASPDEAFERTPADGVAVWRWPRTHDRPGHDYRDFYVDGDEPGVWRPAEDDARRERIVEAAQQVISTAGYSGALEELEVALKAKGANDA